jgi:hypothetical protein
MEGVRSDVARSPVEGLCSRVDYTPPVSVGFALYISTIVMLVMICVCMCMHTIVSSRRAIPLRLSGVIPDSSTRVLYV